MGIVRCKVTVARCVRTPCEAQGTMTTAITATMTSMSTMTRLNLTVTIKEVSEMAAAQEEVDRRVNVKGNLCASNGETKERAFDAFVNVAMLWMFPIEHAEQQIRIMRCMNKALNVVARRKVVDARRLRSVPQ